MSVVPNRTSSRTLLRACAFVPLLGCALAGLTPLTAGVATKAVADFSSAACYSLATGTISLPAASDPEGLDKEIKAVEEMGLTYGVPGRVTAQLGRAGGMLVSQATMGSKSVAGGDIVLAVGGVQPGCRILLLADPDPGLADAVAVDLSRNGWRAIPAMTATRGAITRRGFIRRDGKGTPYLLNLMVLGDENARLRLFTTVVRIPPGVALPAGY